VRASEGKVEALLRIPGGPWVLRWRLVDGRETRSWGEGEGKCAGIRYGNMKVDRREKSSTSWGKRRGERGRSEESDGASTGLFGHLLVLRVPACKE